MKKVLLLILLASIVSACTTSTYSFEDVETSLREHGGTLEEVERKGTGGLFARELSGVIPKTYLYEGSSLTIYIFSSTKKRKKGEKAFDEYLINIPAMVVEHQIITAKNVMAINSGGVNFIEGTTGRVRDALNALK